MGKITSALTRPRLEDAVRELQQRTFGSHQKALFGPSNLLVRGVTPRLQGSERSPDPETRDNLLGMIAARSPMSWAHINMLGEYDFSDETLRDALGILPLKSVA